MSESNLLAEMKTTLWGYSGNNGLNGDVKRHDKQIGELYGRDEALRKDIDKKLEGILRLLFYLTVAVATGAIGMVGTLLATQL